MRKTSVRRRLQLLLFSAGMLSFIVLGAASVLSMYRLHQDALNYGREMVLHALSDVTDITLHLAEQQLMTIAQEKTNHVEGALYEIKKDLAYIARMMEYTVAEGRTVVYEGLKDPSVDPIKSGEPYLYCEPSIRNQEAMEMLAGEIAASSHIANILDNIADSYAGDRGSIFIASKSGYIYSVELLPTDQEYVVFTEKFMETYVPQERPWFKAAMEAGQATVTDIYKDYDGEAVITYAAPYYVNGEFAGVAGIGFDLQSLYQEVSKKNFSSDTINFVLNNKGIVVASSATEGILAASEAAIDLRDSGEKDLAEVSALMVNGQSGSARITVGGIEYLLAYAPIASMGWSFGTMARVDELLVPAKTAQDEMMSHEGEAAMLMESFLNGAIWEILVIMAIFAAGLAWFSRRTADHFVTPILALKEGVGEITKGRLDEKLDIRTGDEIEELSNSVNYMTGELKHYMDNLSEAEAEKERIATELELAKSIQSSMLPKTFPKGRESEGFELYAALTTASEVGGDFYDFYVLDDSHLAVTLAYVGDFGVPASLFMMISKSILKSEILAAAAGGVDSVDWGRVMERVNRKLCENNGEDTMFAAVYFAVLNTRTGALEYVDAGGKTPLLGHANEGKMEWQYMMEPQKGSAMGVTENAEYKVGRMVLAPGDMVYFYTDGVIRAMDTEGRPYTEESLLEALCREGQPEFEVKSLVERILEAVEQHKAGADQVDDFTMMGLRYWGTEKNNKNN